MFCVREVGSFPPFSKRLLQNKSSADQIKSTATRPKLKQILATSRDPPPRSTPSNLENTTSVYTFTKHFPTPDLTGLTLDGNFSAFVLAYLRLLYPSKPCQLPFASSNTGTRLIQQSCRQKESVCYQPPLYECEWLTTPLGISPHHFQTSKCPTPRSSTQATPSDAAPISAPRPRPHLGAVPSHGSSRAHLASLHFWEDFPAAPPAPEDTRGQSRQPETTASAHAANLHCASLVAFPAIDGGPLAPNESFPSALKPGGG